MVGAAAFWAARGWQKRQPHSVSEAAVIDDDVGDWPAFLSSWNERAKAVVAQSLLRFGVAGPLSSGIAAYVRDDASSKAVDVPTGLLDPLKGSAESEQGIGVLFQEAKRRLMELERLVDTTYVVSYEWAVIKNGGLSRAPASAQQIRSSEQRLGEDLPDSYCQFVAASNGWLTYTSRLMPVEGLERFEDKDPQYVKDWSMDAPGGVADSDYFVYGTKQLPYNIRTRYLKNCLVIGEPLTEESERLLLNPNITFQGGEFEAWLMIPRLGGAVRYRSFAGLMRSLRESDEAAWRRIGV